MGSGKTGAVQAGNSKPLLRSTASMSSNSPTCETLVTFYKVIGFNEFISITECKRILSPLQYSWSNRHIKRPVVDCKHRNPSLDLGALTIGYTLHRILDKVLSLDRGSAWSAADNIFSLFASNENFLHNRRLLAADRQGLVAIVLAIVYHTDLVTTAPPTNSAHS